MDSLDRHPHQPHLVAIGRGDGSLCFMDMRQHKRGMQLVGAHSSHGQCESCLLGGLYIICCAEWGGFGIMNPLIHPWEGVHRGLTNPSVCRISPDHSQGYDGMEGSGVFYSQGYDGTEGSLL